MIYLNLFYSETKLEEMNLPEDKVLEKLNSVSMAKRLANMVSFLHNKAEKYLSCSGTG
jgi:hypothetical protein